MLTKEEITKLKIFSKQMQIETVKEIASIGNGHIGGSLSICDVLALLYGKVMKYKPEEPKWEGRDRLIVSKGHSGPAVYSALALKGFMPISELCTLNRPGTHLPSHCDRNLTPGIDMTTGSLGQGGSVAAGMALGLKMDEKPSKVFLILGDGEIQEGQVWEMALFASHHGLDNLIAFVDNNGLQIDGAVDDVNALGDIADKFSSFGWYAQTVDGHDFELIDEAVERAYENKGKPSVIVLKTIKGHGWSEIENKIGSHHRPISDEDAKRAVAEMTEELNALTGGQI